jgi:hypothetical protein
MTKSIHIAVLLTLLGVLVLLIMPHFLPLRPQATLTILSAKLESLSKLQATMDVQNVFTYGQCQAWRGFLDGHLITVGMMGTDPQKAEVCTDWLLRKFSTRLVLVTEESADNGLTPASVLSTGSVAVYTATHDLRQSNASLLEVLDYAVLPADNALPTDSAPSTDRGQNVTSLEDIIRREAARAATPSFTSPDIFAHRLNSKIQQPINTLVARIAGTNNTPWIIVPLSETPTQKDPLLMLTRKMLEHYDTIPTPTLTVDSRQ